MNFETGVLYLIPMPLSKGVSAKSFTPYLINTLNQIKEYIVENEKTARFFLKEAGLLLPQSELIINDYGKHSRQVKKDSFFKGLLAGNDVGLMSEAGCPGIADPGSDIVLKAHQLQIRVVPLVGPSAILLALMGSGFNGQSFTFQGYLPIDGFQRIKKLKDLEASSKRYGQPQLFIETPFRNNKVLEDILNNCRLETQLCIACNLTAIDEFISTRSVQEWKNQSLDLHKKPTVFILNSNR